MNKDLLNINLCDITDDFILENLQNKKGQPNSSLSTLLKAGRFPNISIYLNNRFKDSESMAETFWRIKNKVEIRPTCLNCRKPLKFKSNGFGKYCSAVCQNSDPVKIQKDKETKLERYGDPNYNNMEKNRQTCLEHWGVNSYSKTQKHKNKMKNAPYKMGSEYFKEKAKQTKIEKYNDPNYNNRAKAEETTLLKYGVKNTKQTQIAKEREKETCIKKYGVTSYRKTNECEQKIRKTIQEKWRVEHITKSKVWIEKWYSNNEWSTHRTQARLETMKNNNSYKASKTELYIYEQLKAIYPNIKYQYSIDSRYPFNCDFYIPEKDLFIEYNGYWTHGKMTYDSNNDQCVNLLNKWKKLENEQIEKGNIKNLYSAAIYTWTVRDIEKIRIAKENNLNYIILWYNDYKDIDYIKYRIDQY